jgi:Domain of unknown function (DUF6379)
MFEKYMVMSRGFQNVVQDGAIIGFQIKIRITYYRGIYLALIGGLDLTVDGVKTRPEQLRFSIAGRSYTLDQLTKEETVHWAFGEPATLTVLKPGGLKPGIHEIQLEEVIKPAYIPGRGFVAHTTRKATLVA